MLVAINAIIWLLLRQANKSGGNLNVFIVTSNIRIGMMYNIVSDVPHIRIGANKMEKNAKKTINLTIGRQGSVNCIVTDVEADESTKNRSEEHTSELQSRENLVCRLLLEKK